MNTVGRTSVENNLVYSNLNRQRPLKWVRFAEPGNQSAVPGPQTWKMAIENHITGGHRAEQLVQVMSTMIRRPRHMRSHLTTLRNMRYSDVVRMHSLSLFAFEDSEQRIMENIFAVFWKYERVPMIPVKPPASLNPRSRNIFLKRILIPWMRSQKFRVVKWSGQRKETPTLEGLCENHTRVSAKAHPQRK